MDLKESCEIPSTFRNELKGYMPYVQKPTFTAQFPKTKTETVANNHHHHQNQQRLPTTNKVQITTRGSYRGDVSNPTVLYTFNKDLIDDKEPHELLNHNKNTQRISVYDISMNYENGFGSTKKMPNMINCQLPAARFSETIEDNETVPHLPCAGFIEVSPKHLETEERLPTDFVTDRYRSPSPSKRRQGDSNDSPVINCQRRLEYSSKISINNVRISDQISLQMSKENGLMTFESVAFENKTNLAHLGGLGSAPNKKPLESIANQMVESRKEQHVELESLHIKQELDSEHIASISSPSKIRNTANTSSNHKRSMSSQPTSKGQKMTEVQLFKDRVYEYNQNGFDRYSQNTHNQTYNVLENDTSMINPHNACNSMEQGRNDNVNVSDILYQAKRFDKLCMDQSMEPTTHILEFEETVRLRPSTGKKSYDLPRQMGDSSHKKMPASERKTEPLLCHNQSSIINVSQEASERPNQEQGSLIDFTLKSSERPQVKSDTQRDLCSQFLNRITEKGRNSIEQSHSTLNPSSTSLLSFSKDGSGSGPSEAQLLENKCQASFNNMSQSLHKEQLVDQEGSKANYTKEISVVFAESKLLDNHPQSHFESQILTASATLNTTDKSRKKAIDERGFGVPECQEVVAQNTNILEEESKTELSAHSLDHRNTHNPDLIAHIEYNYQPENFKLNESVSKTEENNQVYICKTLEEMDFAEPNLIAIKSIENAKDLQSLVLNQTTNYDKIVKKTNAEVLRSSIPPQVQKVTQRPPLYMKSSFTSDQGKHHHQTKETAISLNSITNLDESLLSRAYTPHHNVSFGAEKTTYDFSLNLTQVPTIHMRRFSQTVETKTTATKVLELDFSETPVGGAKHNEPITIHKLDLGETTPKEKGPKRVAQLREKLCLAPIVLLSQHQEDLKSLRLASASPSPTKHESNLKQTNQDLTSCTTHEKGSETFKLYNTNFELQRIERKLAKYRDENTVTELKQKEQKVYSTASKTPLRADTGMNFSNIKVGRSQTPNSYTGKSRESSLDFLKLTGGFTASKGFKLKLHSQRR